MKRIFVAIEISEQAKREVLAYIKALQSEFRLLPVAWVKEEKLHLTLKFFGDFEEN